jgi:probable HAF family extracellular repeat protein
MDPHPEHLRAAARAHSACRRAAQTGFTYRIGKPRGGVVLCVAAVAFVCAVGMPGPSNAANSCAGAPPACFQGLGFLPGGTYSAALAVSPDGSWIVGEAGNAAGNVEAFLRWVGGNMIGLALPQGATSSYASGVSSNGIFLVGTVRYSDGHQEAFRWFAGLASGLGFLPGQTSSEATGVSDDGRVVVGRSWNTPDLTTSQAYRWSAGITDLGGTMTGLGFLPGDSSSEAHGVSRDGSVVVGTSRSAASGGAEAFRWGNGTMSGLGFLPQQSLSFATAVSGDGNLVLGAGADREEIFLWRGSMIGLGNGMAGTLNGDGSIVAAISDARGDDDSSRWSIRTGWQPLPDLLAAQGVAEVQGWSLDTVTAVSADGTVFVGIGTDPDGHTQAWMARLPVPAAAHDFDGGGKSDIAWRDAGGDVAIWLMNGATVSSSRAGGNVPASWSIVGQRDFDGDGRSDLLWRDSDGNTSIWFIGPAQIAAAAIGNIPSTWTVVGTADFNGDGMGDILWQDAGGNVAVWLMSGANVLASAGVGNVPANVIVAGTGDFDGNGQADILWRDSNGNAFIWFMHGTQVAAAAPMGNVPTNWSVVGTGDFNGDGKRDIVWRDSAGNTSIWLMNGAAVLSAGSLGNVPTAWSIVQTGDYDGDGLTDLLWRDGSGNTSIWFMNGVAVTSTAAVGFIPGNWTVQSTNAE